MPSGRAGMVCLELKEQRSPSKPRDPESSMGPWHGSIRVWVGRQMCMENKVSLGAAVPRGSQPSFFPDQCSVHNQHKLFIVQEKGSNYTLISAHLPQHLFCHYSHALCGLYYRKEGCQDYCFCGQIWTRVTHQKRKKISIRWTGSKDSANCLQKKSFHISNVFPCWGFCI